MAADVGGGLLVDRLSGLPDALLVFILSLLPLDEAARCTVLASCWRRLFSSDLLVDFNAEMPGCRNVFKAINAILAAHPAAPIRSFHTRKRFLGCWLLELARRGVQELDLNLDILDSWSRPKISPSLFACASLTRLTLGNCIFPNASKTAAGVPRLSRLTEIDLWGVTISDTSLNILLSQCPALEGLTMQKVGKFDRIHVRSPSLKFLHCHCEFDELFVEYAPKLERVYGLYIYLMRARFMAGARLRIVHAPKLEFLGYLGMNFQAIEIRDTILAEDGVHLKALMPSLKTPAIEVSYKKKGYISWITQLLELFPCLESLYSDTWPAIQGAAQESWDVLRCIPCIDNHLQKVVFEVYKGHEWQREMAKFLHGRSMFLKAMEFHCVEETNTPGGHFKVPSEEWFREQQELLCLDSCASKDARFLFFKRRLVYNHHGWYKRVSTMMTLYEV